MIYEKTSLEDDYIYIYIYKVVIMIYYCHRELLYN